MQPWSLLLICSFYISLFYFQKQKNKKGLLCYKKISQTRKTWVGWGLYVENR